MTGVLQTLVAFSMCWLVASSLWIYPHSLSYFNESIGGPMKGPEHLLGSNVDWGQDLSYVVSWIDRQELKVPLRSAYFAGYSPVTIGLPRSLPLPDAFQNGDFPAATNQDILSSGTKWRSRTDAELVVISMNLVHGCCWPGWNGGAGLAFLDSRISEELRLTSPAAMCGYSICVRQAPALGGE